jgi:hypothetical protein
MFSRSMFVLLLVFLAVSPGLETQAETGKSVGKFPVREPDEDTPLYVVWEVLKAGVETDENAGRKAYVKLCLKDRKPSPKEVAELEQKEFENLRSQAGAYLKHDLHGFKLIVEEMTPGPAFVDKKTRKVYVTVQHQLEPDDRKGLFIVERDGAAQWRLRSLNL